MSQFKSEGSYNTNTFSPASQSGFSTVTAGLLVIIVALVGAAGFVYQKDQKRIGLLERNFIRVEERLVLKNAATKEFKVGLAKVSADVSTQDTIVQRHLKALEETLIKVGTRVNKLEDSSSQEWLLSEIEYLMKMADHRILMKEDVKGAIALLQSAESVIAKVPGEDSGLNNVRNAIVKDITSMEVFKGVDVPGTYAQLVALGGLVEKLPLVPLESVAVPAEGVVEDEGSSFIDKINRSMGKYLTIRQYSDADLERMLTEDQREGLKTSVLLSLEQAQMAILRGEQTIYDASLKKVRLSLLNYFQADDYRVEIAKLKLDKLIDVKIETELPNIANSQQELKRYLSSRVRISQH
ncbi:MAG: uroporphyrinogen-III C-methyltransferase [Sinobacterium sp.]|nr:uroporphyrinogen-III C-methyltransferase [Sinobacterium sp.]